LVVIANRETVWRPRRSGWLGPILKLENNFMNWRACIFLAIFCIPNYQVEAKTYNWRDENGTMHFTDDPTKIPRKKSPPVNTKAHGLEGEIYFECKTKTNHTNILKLDSTRQELIWVKDNDGLMINFPMKTEEYSVRNIKSSFTAEQMLQALFSIKDLDSKYLADLGLMKIMYQTFLAHTERLIRQGVSPEESKRRAQESLRIDITSKQYVELDLISGKIVWTETDLQPKTSRGQEVKTKVRQGKCTKIDGNY